MRSYKIFHVLVVIISLIIGGACANMGRPGGGPKDEDPPYMIKSRPEIGALNFKEKTVEIFFNELISIEKPFEKVIVSPPQKESPRVRSISNKAIVELKDSLKENTTYVIDFSDAIVDFNEANKMGLFSFLFSTGSVLDSMRISGYLINAETLEPMTGVYIGVHSSKEDSAFTTQPFDHISRTSDTGEFSVFGLKEGSFKVYALKEQNRNFKFDQETEEIAFSDSLWKTSVSTILVNDTIFTDSLTVDSIVAVPTTLYHPSDILLKGFKEYRHNPYFIKAERSIKEKITFIFGDQVDSLPRISPLNFKECFQEEFSSRRDTLSYWLTDKEVAKQDTISFTLKYQKADSTGLFRWTEDTLRLYARQPKVAAKGKGKQENTMAEQTVHLPVSFKTDKMMEVYQYPTLWIDFPVDSIDQKKIKVESKKDSLYKAFAYQLRQDSLLKRRYYFEAEWEPEAEYRIQIDSAAIYSIYGLSNNTIEHPFKVRPLEEYSNLFVSVQDSCAHLMVELLNQKGDPVERLPVTDGTVEFWYLKPGTYYMRAYRDTNNNGKWDTGNYRLKRQPEEMFYCPKKLELRANWDVEESWTPTSIPLMEQKPKELIQTSEKK